jgi:hypothetical protein
LFTLKLPKEYSFGLAWHSFWSNNGPKIFLFKNKEGSTLVCDFGVEMQGIIFLKFVAIEINL